MKVRCRECRRTFEGRVPKGGDGSALLPVWHKTWKFSDTHSRSDRRVPCPGRFEEGEWLEAAHNHTNRKDEAP